MGLGLKNKVFTLYYRAYKLKKSVVFKFIKIVQSILFHSIVLIKSIFNPQKKIFSSIVCKKF